MHLQNDSGTTQFLPQHGRAPKSLSHPGHMKLDSSSHTASGSGPPSHCLSPPRWPSQAAMAAASGNTAECKFETWLDLVTEQLPGSTDLGKLAACSLGLARCQGRGQWTPGSGRSGCSRQNLPQRDERRTHVCVSPSDSKEESLPSYFSPSANFSFNSQGGAAWLWDCTHPSYHSHGIPRLITLAYLLVVRKTGIDLRTAANVRLP